jgi:hypothetical protein
MNAYTDSLVNRTFEELEHSPLTRPNPVKARPRPVRETCHVAVVMSNIYPEDGPGRRLLRGSRLVLVLGENGRVVYLIPVPPTVHTTRLH